MREGFVLMEEARCDGSLVRWKRPPHRDARRSSPARHHTTGARTSTYPAQMKFGKDLQQYKLPGWEDDYLDYKGLKYILKKLEEGIPREEVDGEFFQALEDDLEKARRPRPCWPGLLFHHRCATPSGTDEPPALRRR